MGLSLSEKRFCYFVVTSCCIFLATILYVFRSPFVLEYKLEAGNSLEIKDLLIDDVEASFETKIDDLIIREVGTHPIKLKAKGMKYTVNIETVDTVAPKVKVKEKTIFLNDPVAPKDFIESIEDETKVNAQFINKIDTSKEGKVDVQLLFIDEGQNEVKIETKATIKKDTEGPVIHTPSSIIVKKGDTVAYKKDVTVIDNRDGEIKDYKIDSSQVKLNQIGTYCVTYSAEDQLKNKTSKVVQVRVIGYDLNEVKKEADQYADKILKNLVNNKMTKAQKVEKIYNYVRSHYTYNGQHEGTIDDFYKDALTGFKTGRGDCFVVNAMARYLLEKEEIETYGLLLKGNTENHVSFMTNTGDGWYHYVAFNMKSARIFKWTDQKMIAFFKKADGVKSIPKNVVPSTPKK